MRFGRPVDSITLYHVALPLFGAVLGIGTITVVYILTKSAGHLPDGVSTPPISLLGCQSPEHEFYQVGFALTGLALLTCVRLWAATFYPRIRRAVPASSRAALFGGYLAAVGVIGQGIVTLDEDFLERLGQGHIMSQQSTLHQGIAGLFFVGAAVHCYATCYICLLGGDEEAATLYSFGGNVMKFACLLVSMVAYPVAEAMHPASSGNPSLHNMNVGGLAQYATVGSYILFFGSYALDFLVQRRAAAAASLKKQKLH
mmetsp:Transcript_9656/g.28917  ORF Transcript_9656/g.28917 Transcript_9656/m.28917 type:complete len:257 (-) Transcript_9656:62-832(-)